MNLDAYLDTYVVKILKSYPDNGNSKIIDIIKFPNPLKDMNFQSFIKNAHSKFKLKSTKYQNIYYQFKIYWPHVGFHQREIEKLVELKKSGLETIIEETN